MVSSQSYRCHNLTSQKILDCARSIQMNGELAGISMCALAGQHSLYESEYYYPFGKC